MTKVLVTGGAGYKGTLLVEALLEEGCEVRIVDNFLYGHDTILGFIPNKNFSAVKKDIRNIESEDVAGYDIVYHLAGISGYPACEANPHSAHTINVGATRKLVNLMGNDQLLVYASTTSMYGSSGKEMDETATLKPVSLYGVTKLEAERICLDKENSVSFRFATLFGASRKMRCDLMLNDFVHKAVMERNVVLFDHHSVRTFLHVRDAIRAYTMLLKQSDAMVGEIFNVGAENMNFSKLQLAEKIQEHIPFQIIKSELTDPDRRDFLINFDKISALGFKAEIGIDEGIQELIRMYAWYRPHLPYEII